MAAVLGLIIGVVLGVFVKPDIPIILQPYLPIMVVAALDALTGSGPRVLRAQLLRQGVRHLVHLERGHRDAAGVPGQSAGASDPQLQTAVIVVLGIRIFSNGVGNPSLHLPGVMNHGGAQIVS